MAVLPTGQVFSNAIGNTLAQGAGQAALNTGANSMLSNFMSTGLPSLNTGLLSSLAGLGGKLWDFAGSQQTANAVGAAGNIFSGFNQYNQGKQFGKVLKSQEARAADAYARDKEADAKRQLLTF